MYFHAMFLCINYNLSGLIKAHWHAIEQSRGKSIRVIMFQPTGYIDKQSKACCMAFRKTVAAKTFKLFEDASCEFLGIALLDHAVYEFLLIRIHFSVRFESGHASP